jgi:hypothetical protein
MKHVEIIIVDGVMTKRPTHTTGHTAPSEVKECGPFTKLYQYVHEC